MAKYFSMFMHEAFIKYVILGLECFMHLINYIFPKFHFLTQDIKEFCFPKGASIISRNSCPVWKKLHLIDENVYNICSIYSKSSNPLRILPLQVKISQYAISPAHGQSEYHL